MINNTVSATTHFIAPVSCFLHGRSASKLVTVLTCFRIPMRRSSFLRRFGANGVETAEFDSSCAAATAVAVVHGVRRRHDHTGTLLLRVSRRSADGNENPSQRMLFL